MTKLLMLLFLPVVIFLSSASAVSADETLDRIYYYLARTQSEEGPVGKDFFLTSEQALCAIAFLNRGHYNRAKRIISFYDDIYRSVRSSAGFSGFALRYDRHGSVIDDKRDYYDQTLLLLSIVHYTRKTGDRRFVRIADAIAGQFKNRINRWGAFFHEDMSMHARQNLFAYTVFRAISGIKQDVDYARYARRIRYVLNDLFYDNGRKMLRNSINENLFVPSDQILGRMILSSEIIVPTDAHDSLDWLLMRNLSDAIYKNAPAAEELEKHTKFSPDVPGGAYISDAEGNLALGDTCLYLFVKERFNPFAIASELSAERIALISAQKGELFRGDNFEDDVIHFYRGNKDASVNADLTVTYDERVKKSGERSLRVHFTPLSDARAFVTLSRVFYPPQDFTKFGRIKFWLRASPGVPGSMSVRIKLKLVDEDGNIIETSPLNYSARGVENTVIFPGAFAALGRTRLNAEKIVSMDWVFEEATQTAWSIQLDELIME